MKSNSIKYYIKFGLILTATLTLTASLVLATYLVLKPKDIRFGLATILPGDVDGDNDVDIIDFQLLSNTFGKASGQTGYDARADFNSDNVVDILDFQILSNNFGKVATTGTVTPTTNPSVTSAPTPTTVPLSFLPAFPGAEGFGAKSVGGRGGTVYRVTNLSDSGTGSLRACAEASGPRYCIFDTSGTIQLSGKLTIKNPYLTIAGQTAPSPGITLRNAPIELKTHDVIFQHFRIRVGDQSSVNPLDLDGMSILGSGSKNVIVDHISISWAVDENISTWYDGVSDITLSNSIISEALNNSTHPEGAHSKGFLIGDYAKNVAVINNVFAHNFDRNPFIKGGTTSVVLNNIFYDWGKPYGTRIGSGDSTGAGPILTTVLNNVYIKGVDTSASSDAVSKDLVPANSLWYISGNKIEGVNPGLTSNTSSSPIWTSLLSPDPSSNLETSLVKYSGARPLDRDSVDTRVINQLVTRTGKIIDSQNQVGGWPNLTVNSRTFPVPTNPNGDDDHDGYTNLEEALQQYASQLEGR